VCVFCALVCFLFHPPQKNGPQPAPRGFVGVRSRLFTLLILFRFVAFWLCSRFLISLFVFTLASMHVFVVCYVFVLFLFFVGDVLFFIDVLYFGFGFVFLLFCWCQFKEAAYCFLAVRFLFIALRSDIYGLYTDYKSGFGVLAQILLASRYPWSGFCFTR